MNITFAAFLAVSLLLFGGLTTRSGAQEMSAQTLRPAQQSIVTIAAFTARGDLPKLKVAFSEGLDAGLTVNEIKEILVQMYAY